jgi:hypothetical protein
VKKTIVYKSLAKTPTILGLPMKGGEWLFGVSLGNAIIWLVMPFSIWLRLAFIAAVPGIMYLGMFLFFTKYTMESFNKAMFSKKIEAIKNNSFAPFKHYDTKD